MSGSKSPATPPTPRVTLNWRAGALDGATRFGFGRDADKAAARKLHAVLQQTLCSLTGQFNTYTLRW